MAAKKKALRHIVVIVNPDNHYQNALDVAASIAGIDSDITAIGLAEELPLSTSLLNPSRRDALQKLVEKDIEQRIEGQCKEHLSGRNFTVRVLTGSPLINIIREFKNFPPDLVVKDSEASAAGKGIPWGSLDMKLARKFPAPVLLLTGPLHKGANFAAALDPEPDNEERNQLCDKVLETTTVFSSYYDATVFGIRAWRPWAEQILSHHFNAAELREFHDDQEKQLRKAYDQAVARHNGQQIRPIFQEGDPVPVLLENVYDEEIELLVLGTVARQGITGYLIGSTAESILHNIPCSVLVLKPDGFKTPIE